MGVYDEYEPQPSPLCPWCGEPSAPRWQGMDGPNAFLVWRQRERHPVDQAVDDDARWDPSRYADLVLPDNFSITGWCSNGHFFNADCRCVEGVWTETDLATERAKVEEAREARRGFFAPPPP